MTRRKRKHPTRPDEPAAADALSIHRELQYLRAAGLTRRRKPNARKRAGNGRPNPRWVAERWRKLQEARRRRRNR